jgi:chromosome segregation ATPase
MSNDAFSIEDITKLGDNLAGLEELAGTYRRTFQEISRLNHELENSESNFKAAAEKAENLRVEVKRLLRDRDIQNDTDKRLRERIGVLLDTIGELNDKLEEASRPTQIHITDIEAAAREFGAMHSLSYATSLITKHTKQVDREAISTAIYNVWKDRGDLIGAADAVIEVLGLPSQNPTVTDQERRIEDLEARLKAEKPVVVLPKQRDEKNETWWTRDYRGGFNAGLLMVRQALDRAGIAWEEEA